MFEADFLVEVVAFVVFGLDFQFDGFYTCGIWSMVARLVIKDCFMVSLCRFNNVNIISW